jgi:hypothetical protein
VFQIACFQAANDSYIATFMPGNNILLKQLLIGNAVENRAFSVRIFDKPIRAPSDRHLIADESMPLTC